MKSYNTGYSMGERMKWYRVRVLITVDLKVLAFDKEQAKEIAIEELANEILSDGCELLGVKRRVLCVDDLEEKQGD